MGFVHNCIYNSYIYLYIHTLIESHYMYVNKYYSVYSLSLCVGNTECSAECVRSWIRNVPESEGERVRAGLRARGVGGGGADAWAAEAAGARVPRRRRVGELVRARPRTRAQTQTQTHKLVLFQIGQKEGILPWVQARAHANARSRTFKARTSPRAGAFGDFLYVTFIHIYRFIYVLLYWPTKRRGRSRRRRSTDPSL